VAEEAIKSLKKILECLLNIISVRCVINLHILKKRMTSEINYVLLFKKKFNKKIFKKSESVKMGGASGLNILQQKSWHVLRRHNIERVRKDQREEKERQQKEDDRKDLAEFESKLDHLRCVRLCNNSF